MAMDVHGGKAARRRSARAGKEGRQAPRGHGATQERRPAATPDRDGEYRRERSLLPRNGDACAGRRRRGTLKPPRHPPHPDRRPAGHALSTLSGSRPVCCSRQSVGGGRPLRSLRPSAPHRPAGTARLLPVDAAARRDLLAPRDALWSFSGQRRATVLVGASTRGGGARSPASDGGRRRARRVLRSVVGRGLPPGRRSALRRPGVSGREDAQPGGPIGFIPGAVDANASLGQKRGPAGKVAIQTSMSGSAPRSLQ
jgi:hypothetical protein